MRDCPYFYVCTSRSSTFVIAVDDYRRHLLSSLEAHLDCLIQILRIPSKENHDAPGSSPSASAWILSYFDDSDSCNTPLSHTRVAGLYLTAPPTPFHSSDDRAAPSIFCFELNRSQEPRPSSQTRLMFPPFAVASKPVLEYALHPTPRTAF